MEQLRFFWEKLSVAAAKTANSMEGSVSSPISGSSALGEGGGVGRGGVLRRMVMALSKPFELGARKE